MVECPKKDIDMMKEKGKNKAFGRGKNPPQQQMLDGKCVSGYGNEWTWNGPWDASWKGESGVHYVVEQCAWQSGDGTTLFGLEVRTSTIEEAQNKVGALLSESVQCGKTSYTHSGSEISDMCEHSRF